MRNFDLFFYIFHYETKHEKIIFLTFFFIYFSTFQVLMGANEILFDWF